MRNDSANLRKQSNGSSSFRALFKRVQNVKTKLEIDLRDNYLDDSIVVAIVDLLEINPNIQELVVWLPSNYITDIGAVALFKEIAKLKKLRQLIVNLEWNFDITNKSVEALCKAIRSLPEIDSLIIRMSRLSY